MWRFAASVRMDLDARAEVGSMPPGPFRALLGESVDGVTVCRVCGDLDVATAPRLRDLLSTAVETGCRRLVIDLSEVGFIDSTGLSVLVVMTRRLGPGSISLVSPGDEVVRILELTGLTPFFELIASTEEHPRAAAA
jgi:anti-anti-sigma factor